MWRKVGYTRVGPVSMWIHSVWGGVLACAAHTPHSGVPWDPRPQLGQPRCHGRFVLLDFPHNKGSCTGEGGRPRGPNRLSQFSPGYGLFWKGQSPTVLRPLVAFHMPSLAGIIRRKSGAPIQSDSPESPSLMNTASSNSCLPAGLPWVHFPHLEVCSLQRQRRALSYPHRAGTKPVPLAGTLPCIS